MCLYNSSKITKIFSIVLSWLLLCSAPFSLVAAPLDQAQTQQNSMNYKNSENLINNIQKELNNSLKSLAESKSYLQDLKTQLTQAQQLLITALQQSSIAKEQLAVASDLVIQLNNQIAAQKVVLENQLNYSASLEKSLDNLRNELKAEKTIRIFNDVGFTLAGFILGAILSWVYFCGPGFNK